MEKGPLGPLGTGSELETLAIFVLSALQVAATARERALRWDFAPLPSWPQDLQSLVCPRPRGSGYKGGLYPVDDGEPEAAAGQGGTTGWEPRLN